MGLGRSTRDGRSLSLPTDSGVLQHARRTRCGLLRHLQLLLHYVAPLQLQAHRRPPQPLEWKFLQEFGERTAREEVQEVNIISAVEFDKIGEHLATGDKENFSSGFHVEKRQSSLVLCWQRKELILASAWSDDRWKFKDGYVMLTNGIDSRSGDDVVLENDGVLGATGFGNLHHVELLQKPDANQGFGCY
ncbi:hypothetical protein F0562_003269 [Nyssa sinensis]|uniref:Uncharacterized protein n=1 Tax=Nyssa sinensis TaxID=561372 RepID=A0A5J5BYM2_9ASTE|nr:hypothetical protein F0562_003269 [Nyssa sinensis]